MSLYKGSSDSLGKACGDRVWSIGLDLIYYNISKDVYILHNNLLSFPSWFKDEEA
jgi:hypothetical protein